MDTTLLAVVWKISIAKIIVSLKICQKRLRLSFSSKMICSFVTAADPALQAFSELMESARLFDTGVRRALSSCWLGSDAAEQS